MTIISCRDRESLVANGTGNVMTPSHHETPPSGVNSILGRTTLAAHRKRIPTHTTSPVHFAIRRDRDEGSVLRIAIFYRGLGAMDVPHLGQRTMHEVVIKWRAVNTC